MKILKNILLWVSLISLAACSAMPTTHSGFLSSGALVTPHEESALYEKREGLQVSWQVEAGHDISEQEQQELKGLLRREIKTALAKKANEKAVKIPLEAIQIRAAITRIEAVSPALNWFTTIVLFVPMDHGGAAVELEAVDIRSNKVITQLRFASWTPISELRAHFTRLAPANVALTAAAHEFVGQLVAMAEQ